MLIDLVLPENKPLLFVSHQPPYATMNDQVSPGCHVGSKSIRKFIEMHQPLICFTGHIHEGIGIDRIGNARIVNPGPAGTGSYAWAEIEGSTIKKLEITQPFQ
jgi:Icc-related predicted phosphoesterase